MLNRKEGERVSGATGLHETFKEGGGLEKGGGERRGGGEEGGVRGDKSGSQPEGAQGIEKKKKGIKKKRKKKASIKPDWEELRDGDS